MSEFVTVSAQEAAKKIGIDRHLMPVLHDTGLLVGVTTGRGKRYRVKDIDRFWDEVSGMDIHNAEAIRLTAAMIAVKKKER